MKERNSKNSRANGSSDIDNLLESLPDYREEEAAPRRRRPKPEEPPKERREAPAKRRKRVKKKKITNKEFARVTYIFVGLFLVTMSYIVYWNVVKSREFVNNTHNKRQDLLADRVIRGMILDKEGNILAKTDVADDGTETREYPYGNMYAHVVGYSAYGKSGLELSQNFNMLTSNAFFVEKIFKELKDEKNTGDNVITTLDSNLQEAAYDAMGDNKGAVIVTEPSTGKVLAMVSKPDFNPNKVAKNWESLNTDKDSALLNRATQGQYAPGSTFKVVTTLAFMRQDPNYKNYSFDCDSEFSYEGTTIHCVNNKVHGKEDLGDSVANSCNASFSNISLKLDIGKYRDTAEELLFNKELPSVVTYRKSKFSLTSKSTAADVMMTAIGQGQLQVSPYHMALITSAVANGGTLMKPYLVDSIVNYKGTVVKKYMPEQYKEIMTPQEAAQLTEYMEEVVDHGTASALSGQGYTAAGKTGTAEYSMDKAKTHSWFIGFSNVDNPDIAVSVIVESSDTSGTKAVNVAKKVFDSYY